MKLLIVLQYENRKMEEDKIIEFITGQLNSDEKKKMLDWISESHENREEYYKLKNLWALTIQFSSPGVSTSEDQNIFHKNIRNKKLKIIRKRVSIVVKYAAIILITFISGKYILQNEKNVPGTVLSYCEITVPPGQMAQIELSDGTNVFINSCSKFRYPTSFNFKERKVFLSGEAYFEVQKGHSPFIVETSTRQVKVLGTKFNVMAYPNVIYYKTTLTEGKIELLVATGNKITGLKPGEQYSMNVSRNCDTIKRVKPDLYDSWKNGIYLFDHETLGGIAERLERIFAVKIYIQNERIKNYKFSGTISRNIPFEQILKIIQISAPIQYKLKEKHGAIEEVRLY